MRLALEKKNVLIFFRRTSDMRQNVCFDIRSFGLTRNLSGTYANVMYITDRWFECCIELLDPINKTGTYTPRPVIKGYRHLIIPTLIFFLSFFRMIQLNPKTYYDAMIVACKHSPCLGLDLLGQQCEAQYLDRNFFFFSSSTLSFNYLETAVVEPPVLAVFEKVTVAVSELECGVQRVG